VRLDPERLLDIVEAIEAIERYVPQGKADFDANELVRVWCLRHIAIIGEAAANISSKTRDRAPTVPWKQIIGSNTLVHAYFDVDWNEVWNVIERDLQPLKTGVQRLLEQIEGQDG
jgi:uncharacterized protein with HEPN domain